MSKYAFNGEEHQVIAVSEPIVSIGQYLEDVFLLTSKGKLYVLLNSGNDFFAPHQVASDVVYADGSQHFAVYITTDGTFSCTAKGDLCPTDDMPGRVHEVASANAEGITLQLKSGELYYKTNNSWVTDSTAIAAGVLEGLLYRLLANGSLLRDGEELYNGVQQVTLTDTDVLVLFKGETGSRSIAALRSGASQTEHGSYFRSPLSVAYTEEKPLSDNGCLAGQLDERGKCVFNCAGYISASGGKCYTALGEYMAVEQGRYVTCTDGFALDEDADECVCRQALSLDGQTCGACGPN